MFGDMKVILGYFKGSVDIFAKKEKISEIIEGMNSVTDGRNTAVRNASEPLASERATKARTTTTVNTNGS